MPRIIALLVAFLFTTFGFFHSSVSIVNTQQSQQLCCPTGYSTGDFACPFGTDQTRQCCKRYGFGQYDVRDRIVCGSTQPPETNLCCPAGFGTGDTDCPFGVDKTRQCCRRFDFGQYEVVDKLQCSARGGLTGNYCCPAGYGTSALDCPAGTDLRTQCCRRLAFGQYERVGKISCTLSPVSTFTGPTTSAAGIPCGANGIATAIGCIPAEPSALVNTLLRFAVGAAGGIAFLLMLIAAFQMISSGGNPDTLKAGQDRFTSAIIGLLFVIFSVLLLQIIGVDILRIPGFLR